MSEWQPIETAPKDGLASMLVRYRGGGIAHVYLTWPAPPFAQTYRYASGPMCGEAAGWPDHWMPIPEGPET